MASMDQAAVDPYEKPGAAQKKRGEVGLWLGEFVYGLW